MPVPTLIGCHVGYHGREFPFLRLTRSYVRAVLRGEQRFTSDAELAAAGGPQPGDRCDVQPYIKSDGYGLRAGGRWSFASSDPLFQDLFDPQPAWRAIPIGGGFAHVCPACAVSLAGELGENEALLGPPAGAVCEGCAVVAGGAA